MAAIATASCYSVPSHTGFSSALQAGSMPDAGTSGNGMQVASPSARLWQRLAAQTCSAALHTTQRGRARARLPPGRVLCATLCGVPGRRAVLRVRRPLVCEDAEDVAALAVVICRALTGGRTGACASARRPLSARIRVATVVAPVDAGNRGCWAVLRPSATAHPVGHIRATTRRTTRARR